MILLVRFGEPAGGSISTVAGTDPLSRGAPPA